MARGRNRGGAAVADPTDDTGILPDAENTDTPEADVTTATEAPATESASTELTDEQVAAALAPFIDAANAAVAERDESTGTVPDASVETVNKAYAQLDGAKLKNAAKRHLNEAMKAAMNDMDVVQARAFMELNEKLKATGAKKAGKAREPKAPVDPTEAFVERAAVLSLANVLVGAVVPEGVSDDWQAQVSAAVEATDVEQIQAYRAWLTDDSEDKGDAPEVSTLISAAVKLSLGKSAKPGKAVKRSSGTSTFTGERRDIGKHILEAFGDKPSGEFMLISQIRKFHSSEYGDDSPSAGAISARLFPKSGKCTLEGVSPATDDNGNKGAVKD